MSRPPPVPPQNRGQKGAGETTAVDRNQAAHGNHVPPDAEHRGQQANTRQNTTHQGLQQDK